MAAERIGLKLLSDSQKFFTIFRELFETKYKGNLSNVVSAQSLCFLSFSGLESSKGTSGLCISQPIESL